MPTLIDYTDFVLDIANQKKTLYIPKNEIRKIMEPIFKEEKIPFVESAFDKAYNELGDLAEALRTEGSA
jgi:hypothetical protein